MNDTSVHERLRQSEERNEALCREMASLRTELECAREEARAVHSDYDALVEATRVMTEERDALARQVAELEVTNRRLVDMLWGRRSERRSISPDQQHFEFSGEPLSAEELEIIMAQARADEATEEELRRRREARRKARAERQDRTETFPPHLERRERLIDLPEEEKEGLVCIGEQVSERLMFKKGWAYVEVVKRPQYAVPSQPEKGVLSAPPPLSIIEGCKYDFSVVASIVAMKNAFHLPTYRQQDWFAQYGWFPRRSTVNDLINYAVDTIEPLYEQMWLLLLQQRLLLGDDTRVRVLLRNALSEEEKAALGNRRDFREALEACLPADAGLPGSALSYAWLYLGLDGMAPYNVFHWSLTHHNSVIDEHLATFRGIFVGDACGANARLEQRSGGRIIHASCNAHARREFVKAESNNPILASQAISLYQQLYDVEERAKGLDAGGRLELRQREAVPIWERMGRWLESEPVVRTLPQSAIGKAVGYLRNQWSALQVYLGDGDVPFDNDQAEQTIRPLTVGRANWLFLGHPRAAPGRLRMYSVVSSAHRHHLMIEDYLEDILRKLADARQNHPADLEPGCSYLLDLLPDRWALAHPEFVRYGRIAENELVAETKRYRRLRTRRQAREAKLAAAR